MVRAAEVLGPHGPLAATLAGFAPRASQQAMAAAVEAALAAGETLVAEAGTGTGKTFAYLVPALLSGRRVIVSTGTKTLQDQLFHRDLPAVRRALDVPVAVSLLKGRANYLCLHRLARAETDGVLGTPRELASLGRLREWARRTRSGDIAEVEEVPEQSPLWPQVTSTADNCLGQDCGHFKDCYVVKARRAAQKAALVVVNHHLLLADMVLKEEGFGDLLPGADAFIIDEAHQLPEVASGFLGASVGTRQLVELARDSIAEYLTEAGDMPEVKEAAEALEKSARDARLAFGLASRRAPWSALTGGPRAALDEVRQALGRLQTLLEAAAERGKGLDNCHRRSLHLGERLAALLAAEQDGHVQWFETYPKSVVFHRTPLRVGPALAAHMLRFQAAWVFTSATLAVADSFAHFCAAAGLADPRTARWDSPFDHARNALLYVPRNLPLPAAPGYTKAVVAAAVPALAASGGRAFFLFTSHRALREAAEILRRAVDYPLLVQGEAPRGELLARFRRLGNAVLLGTGSFWEGVDVRGPALSLVIIDKLPFAAPGDPVLSARIDALRREGGQPFTDYQLPQAAIALKQGVGRLLRDVHDRGVLMLCDPRLVSKAYGKVFLRSLPPMPRSRDIAAVRAFFAREDAHPAAAGEPGR
ncbi:MAG TPA: ATP-dependent DNA helicase [Gammaproteobacteria bacterium]|nr:ATP-dependent DNA helicase [Gammaproteobacteria bacterium]